VQREIPRGTIQVWSGAVADIPLTWRLCDGTRFTPDLRDKFVVGSGDTYAVNATGGAISHSHDFTGIGHDHELENGDGIALGTDRSRITTSTPTTGLLTTKDGRPAYYSLCYIMYDGRLR